MPTPGSPSDCPGLTAIAALKPTDQVFVKLSATYLSPDMDITTVRNLLFSTLGAGRLLWGSDWPWPRHSAQRSYAMEMARSLGAAPAEAIEAMDAAAAWLYRF
jgi:predicted TIM-barrel fold metal-dependent hydrolase